MSQVTENKVIAAPVPMTPLQEFWHYFKRNKGAVVGLVYVVVMIVIAVFANFLAPYNPADQFRDSLLAPPFWHTIFNKFLCIIEPYIRTVGETRNTNKIREGLWP